MASSQRGVTSCSTAKAPTTRSSSSNSCVDERLDRRHDPASDRSRPPRRDAGRAARAASRRPRRASPAPASVAACSSLSVAPPSADTTTTGPRQSWLSGWVAACRAARTMAINRSMAAGSATDVPPNFITIMCVDSLSSAPARAARRLSGSTSTRILSMRRSGSAAPHNNWSPTVKAAEILRPHRQLPQAPDRHAQACRSPRPA